MFNRVQHSYRISKISDTFLRIEMTKIHYQPANRLSLTGLQLQLETGAIWTLRLEFQFFTFILQSPFRLHKYLHFNLQQLCFRACTIFEYLNNPARRTIIISLWFVISFIVFCDKLDKYFWYLLGKYLNFVSWHQIYCSDTCNCIVFNH